MMHPVWPRHLRKQWKREQFKNGNTTCRYCEATLTLEESTVDHVKSLARGGLDVPENYALSCKDCNTRKGSRSVELEDVPLSKRDTFAHEFALAQAQRAAGGPRGRR